MRNENYPDRNVNAVAAGILGVAIGAAAMYLSDKNNRRKVQQKVDEFMGKADQTMEQIRSKMDDFQEKGLDKAEEGSKEISDRAQAVHHQVRKQKKEKDLEEFPEV